MFTINRKPIGASLANLLLLLLLLLLVAHAFAFALALTLARPPLWGALPNRARR